MYVRKKFVRSHKHKKMRASIKYGKSGVSLRTSSPEKGSSEIDELDWKIDTSIRLSKEHGIMQDWAKNHRRATERKERRERRQKFLAAGGVLPHKRPCMHAGLFVPLCAEQKEGLYKKAFQEEKLRVELAKEEVPDSEDEACWAAEAAEMEALLEEAL